MSPIDTLRDFASEGVHLGIPISKQTIRDAVAEHDTLSYRLAASEARVRELEGLLRDFLDQCINDDCSLCERGDAALRAAETLHSTPPE